MELNKKLYLVFFPILLVFSNWILVFYHFQNFGDDITIFLNFNDISYFPFIVSLSDLNFSPSYNDYFQAEGLITFPYASIAFHAIFYKFFGLFGYIFSQIIFVTLTYYLIFYFLRLSGISNEISIFTTLIVFNIPIFLEILSYFFQNDLLFHFKNNIFDYHLTSYRYPRPLVTNIFFYISLILLLRLENFKSLSFKYYLYISIILSLLLQSFIFIFILIGLTIFIIFVENFIKQNNFIKENYLNLILFFIIFLFFSSPFILQNIFAQGDYSARMGLFEIDFEDKIQLMSKTLNHFLNLKYFLYIFFIFLFYFTFKRKFNIKYKKAFRLYLLLFFISFILPFIFVLFSPYLIWYKHFFDVKNLIFLIGLILILGLLFDIINPIKNQKKFKYLLGILCIIFFFLNLLNYSSNLDNKINKKNEYFVELNDVISKSEEFINKKKINIFSNSSLLNHYFIHKNQNILLPHGFHVSLNDNQLEILMFNSLKSIGLTEDGFRKYIKNNISWRSTNNISQITGYKYQFNSIFTYFDIDDYEQNEIDLVKKNELFLSESVALSKSEIEKLVNKFSHHQMIPEIKPDLVIVDNRINSVDFVIPKEYSTLLNDKYFSLFVLNN